MTDSYQAIYDAVRSRISNGDIGNAVSEAAFRAFDVSHLTACVAQDFSMAALEMQRPSVLFKPTLSKDGAFNNIWRASYSGLSVTGKTPYAAMRAFDEQWITP